MSCQTNAASTASVSKKPCCSSAANKQVPQPTPTQQAKKPGCCSDDHCASGTHDQPHTKSHAASNSDCCSATSESSCSSRDDSDSEDDSESAPSGLRLSWLVNGMDCPSCARKVETAVLAIPHIESCRVAFATEKLLVDISPAGGNDMAELIQAAVTKAGFTLQSSAGNTQGNSALQAQAPSLLQSMRDHWHAVILIVSIVIAALASQVDANISQAIFTFASIFGVIPITLRALRLARSGTPFAIETLMSVATIGALVLGETAESAMVLVLFMIGEKLEAFAAGKARSGVKSLMSLVPSEATKLVNGERVVVPADTLVPGDIIEIKPGERLSADAILLDQGISFDESALTGESLPVEHQRDDIVMAGSLAVNRPAQLRVVSEPGNNAIDRILHLIEEAEEHKAPIERFLDRFSRWYTPAMMLLALAVVIVPPLLFQADWNEWVYKGLTLLLIACPCALVISTPAAVTSALSAASRRGVLVKGGAALEQLGNIQQIAFDKTGTLTQGVPVVTKVVAFDYTREQVLQLAASVEQSSNHPLAKAIISAAAQQQLALLPVTDDETLAGLGVQGRVQVNAQVGEDAQTPLIKLLAPHHITALLAGLDEVQVAIAALEAQGNSTVVIVRDEQVIGLIALADSVRDDAAQAIAELKQLGIRCVMLTGDNRRTAKVIADRLGMDYRAELLPADKAGIIAQLNSQCDTAMVGDGINDAPAMKRAKLGIAMGGGTDVALEAADAALMHNRLTALPQMVALGQATLANIKQNIALAVGLKALFLVTTLLGMTGLWVAILADSGATALVTANALRLLRVKDKPMR